MQTLRALVLLAAAIFLGRVSSAVGQTVTGTLSGHVADASGAMVPKVKVVARNEQTGGVREATTNEDGYYLISFVPIGSYELVVAQPGFKTIEKKSVVVELNKNTVSDFALEPSAVAARIEVSGEIPLIETTVGEYKHSLDAKAIENTPLPGRNFISLVEQIPGFQAVPWTEGAANNPTNSTGSYAAFSGTGSRTATFQIDGINNDDSSENQNRQNVNISSIKEFQALTNAYSAEFGRAGGAVILVQTKSGTNAYHGDLYDFIQNDIFNANGFFQNQVGTPRQIIRRNQYGGTLGGPVFKDKLFFFAAGERASNVGSGTMTRFIWLPSDGPRACAPGETARPGRADEPLGNYCVDPATHPNLERDLAFMQKIMNLWKTPELQGKQPNDPKACAEMIGTGRANRCVTVSGVPFSLPFSDYSGKLDWLAGKNTTAVLRYQYSRQISNGSRIIFGDNFGANNNRQYNIGVTLTHVFNASQTGELRYGFGNRNTNQNVTDGNDIPVIRFSSTNTLYTAQGSDTLPFSGTVIGTSTNVPINRFQRDHQLVYNHTKVFSRHTLRMGIDQRFQALDDFSGDRNRGFWTFSTFDTLGAAMNPAPCTVRNPCLVGPTGAPQGFSGWENFLRGVITNYQGGFGDAFAENRFGETNLYAQDDFRLRRNLTLNLGLRWEGVRAPREIRDRFSYGFSGAYDSVEPRIGFAWTPEVKGSWLGKLTGGSGNFVIRGGYGIYHSRLFQSIFSQNQLSIRTQPPNGFAGSFDGLCSNEISDPSCGFVFTHGVASRTSPTSATRGCTVPGTSDNGVRVQCGQLITTLLIPDPNLHLPYVQQWNLTVERRLPWSMAVQVAYTGNRGIGYPFYDSVNNSQFPIDSPLVSVDVGGGNFRAVRFDRACLNNSDPICTNGSLTDFSSLLSPTATLAQKGISIDPSGVPHGYISLTQPRVNERRPDPANRRNVALRNFGWSYYQGMVLKVTKVSSRGLAFTGSWVLSKSIDTGSEATFTNIDANAPTGSRDPARSLRGLSSYDARRRVVLSYSYEFPWMKSQQSVLGRVVGGWLISGVTTFQSGLPYTVLAGYDVNLDGVGGDRPKISDPSFLYRSVDNGRAQSPCPSMVPVCLDTLSQLQVPGSVFIPGNPGTLAGVGGNNLFLTPGEDGTGTIGRNTFFAHGMNNFDASISKSVRVREGMSLQMRMEWYNLFNRTMFGVPARTVLSTTPIGRITSQLNPSGYVNSARIVGSRQGQFALRFIF